MSFFSVKTQYISQKRKKGKKREEKKHRYRGEKERKQEKR